MRDQRYLIPGSLVEVTTTCIQNRFLLRPSERLNEVFVGVLGRAQEAFDLDLVGVSALSSHYHLLAVPESQEQLSEFMGYVNGNLSKEVDRIYDWKGSMWMDRFHQIQVADDEATQVSRLRYLLAQGVKEDLVERPEQWPGVHCAQALREGRPMIGAWVNRTAHYAHRAVLQEDVTEDDFTEEVCLWFSPLPCWAGYSPARYQEEVGVLIEDIVDEAARKRQSKGRTVLGVDAILKQNPHHRPEDVQRSPKPRFHTLCVESYKILYKAFSLVFAEYREASELLRAGFRDAEFPEGTFPCALPFVPMPGPPQPRGDP